MPGNVSITLTVTADLLAAVVAESLEGKPALVRARVMNRLLHEDPEIFAALLKRPPRDDPGKFSARK